MDTRMIQDMIYDQTQNAWVAQQALPNTPAYRRAGLLVGIGRVLLSVAKAIVLITLGVAAAGLFFEQAPWYTRLWSGVTGNFPWLWPF